MKRFQFRLQAALDMRLRRRERMEAELAEVQGRLLEQERQLQYLLDSRRASEERAACARIGRLCPENGRKEERYLADLEEAVARQRDLIDIVRRERERKMAEVVRATQDHRALDDLKSRHAEAHRQDALREEQKFLDEIASIRAARGTVSA